MPPFLCTMVGTANILLALFFFMQFHDMIYPSNISVMCSGILQQSESTQQAKCTVCSFEADRNDQNKMAQRSWGIMRQAAFRCPTVKDKQLRPRTYVSPGHKRRRHSLLSCSSTHESMQEVLGWGSAMGRRWSSGTINYIQGMHS